MPEPRLRHALIAAWGPEVARDAAADALTWAWEHWGRVEAMDNPAGYLYRVGRTAAKRYRRRRVGLEVNTPGSPRCEPGLGEALKRLTERQRACVVLMHSYDWTHVEIGETLGISVPTVQKHAERGLAKLRSALEVTVDA